jgi:hypothetical protein
MDTVVEEGEQSPQQLLSQQKGMAGSGGGGGGGGGGMSPLSALSAGASIASLGAKVLPFFLERGGSVNPYAYGGLVPRERHADGESVGDQPREEPSKGLGVDTIMEKITPSGVNAPENFWVPALSFVGGMLTSPSRTLAGSVGSGLLSGVQGYTDLSKQQAAVAKNVIDVFKDRYTETIDPYTNKPVLHNSFTGQNHQPGEVHAALYKSLKAAGVSPEKYGVFAPGAAKEPPREGGAGTTTQETPRLPAPAAGEGTVVAQTAPAEAPKSGEAKPAEEAAPMSKEMMNRAQLREDVLRNPKMYGLGQEVIDLQARIKGYNDRAKAFSGLGAKGEAEVARNEALAEKEKNRLETLIQNAVDRQDSYNKESDKLQLTSSNKYAEEAEKRMNAYEARRKRLILLSEALADFKAGRASPALASFQSYAKSLGVPIVGNIGDSSYAASFDTALKAASSEIVNDIATSNTQRAPASMSQLLSKAVAGPTMDPGAAYEVLGATLGELDAQHAKDMEFKRGMDPLAFHQQYYKKDPKALDKYTAKAFSDLSIPKGIDPKIIERVNDMYGQHGYRPKGAEEVGAKPAAAPVRVKSIDEARQLPSGTVFIDPNGVTRRVP